MGHPIFKVNTTSQNKARFWGGEGGPVELSSAAVLLDIARQRGHDNNQLQIFAKANVLKRYADNHSMQER